MVIHPVNCRSYVGGRWSDGAGAGVVELGNPADRREIVSRSVHATPQEAARAVEVAVASWDDWRKVPVGLRIALMEKVTASVLERSGDFARAICNETGKTLVEAGQEVDATAAETRVQIELARKGFVEEINGHRVCREPLGAVLLVTPSNFPLAAVMRKLAPALLAGNTAVVKASEMTPLTACLLFGILDGSGVVPGAVNLILADGRAVVPAMIEAPGLKAISMTGSNETGSAIARAIGERNIRLQAEMGGSNAVVVLADAELEEAAAAVVEHGYACCGQWCTGTTRAIVDASVYDGFLALLLDKVARLTVGPGADRATDMGPLISRAQRQRVEDAVTELREAGARVLSGGRKPANADLDHGNFFEPTVLDCAGDCIGCYRALCDREIFGPVVALTKAGSVADAIARANAGRFGLSFSVFTQDRDIAEHFVASVDAGLCHINLPTGFRDNALPLGGHKASGRGIAECGTFARDFFTQTKAVYRRPEAESYQ